MSTVSTHQPAASSVVLNKLRHLRRRLTGWILVHGIGRWLLVLLAILAVDMAVDRVFRMDFAQRLIMLAVMVSVALVYFFWKVIRPLSRQPNNDALLYEVENKHPELHEVLISGWQLSREKNLAATGVSHELVDATIASGISKAEQIDFAKSLDIPHHRQNWLILLMGVIAFGLLGWGVAQNDFFKTWFRRNVLLADDQWPQATYLEIAGVENGTLVLPRGVDHRQLVRVTENSTEQHVNVSIEVDNPSARTSHPMKQTGKLQGREHSHMFHNVSSAFRFRARGGDDTTDWVQVELVEPPAILELELKALLPDYTGTPALSLEGNGPHSVLTGSRLQVSAVVNKSLNKIVLRRDGKEFTLGSTGQALTYATTISAGLLRGGEYKFEMLDESGLANTRPAKFKLTIKEDQPPRARANLLGISGLVVPRAMVPVSWQFSDQYGLKRLYFDARWKVSINDEEQSIDRQIEFADFSKSKEPVRDAKDVEVLDLIPLNLKPGISLRFSAAAMDTCPDPPNVGKSQEFLLRIVTEEELRSDLLRREIEQRKSFEQAYEKQLELTTEILAIAAREKEPNLTGEQFQAQQESDLIALIREQKNVGTAVARVADRFEEFLVEAKNNRLDEAENELAPDQRIETRFDIGIIQPIRQLDSELIALATRNLDNCRRVANNKQSLNAAVDQTSVIHQQILEEMKRILDAMNQSESFQEIINDLIEIKRSANQVKDEIQQKLKPTDIFDDPDNDIFDE